MASDQQIPTERDRQPAAVVVTTPAPDRVADRVEPSPDTTRVEVYPGTSGKIDELATERGTTPLQTRQDVVRGRRMTIGKLIDACWYLLGLLEVGLAIRQPAREVSVRGGDRDVVHDRHGVTQPPANGMTWPTKKSASSDAR